MRRIQRDDDRAFRQERWSFDAAPSDAAQPVEDRHAPEPRDERVMAKAPAQAPPPRPVPRPVKTGESPWRKIHISQEDRRRAAAAGLFRYVGKPPANVYDAQADVRRDAARNAARDEPRPTMAHDESPPVPPEPPRAAVPVAAADAAERAPAQVQAEDSEMDGEDTAQRPAADAAFAQGAIPRPPYRRATDPLPPRAPQGSGNPHLALTVGAILAISLVAAAGLSWIAAPALDRGAALRADILQLISPLTQTAERPIPAAAPLPSYSAIEVAPDPSAPVARTAPVGQTAPVQPIEVAP